MTATAHTETSSDQAATGAASRETDQWRRTDWEHAHRIVRRLQARIVKAHQEGRWGKVKALQRLLTHSQSGRLLAVKRVTGNHGKNTPGVDGMLWETPGKKMAAVHTLRAHGYHPQPLRRVSIPKKNGKMRKLGIPCMRCRAMQTLYLLALDPLAECQADRNSYGFRVGRSPADAISQCFGVLSKKASAQWVLEGDIRACFDEISHDWLLAHVPLEHTLLRNWLKAGVMERHVLTPTEEGTPQGGPLSPVLANLALDGLESLLNQRFPKPKRGRNEKVNYVRFADDFCISGASREVLEHEVQPLVEAFLKERGLELSPEKTVITHIEDGFDFLGQRVQKYHGTMLITPSKKNTQALLEKVREIIRDNKQATAGHLIALLNPLLRGWANYHRHVVSKATFRRVDTAIFQALWRWARRRHPRKGAHWVMKKYFCSIGTRRWVFFGKLDSRHGDSRVHLFWTQDTPIERHVKIREGANPYDPAWEEYFEQRLDLKMIKDLHGRRALLALWLEQDGRCPHCQQKITKETGWESHHLIWRSKGGKETRENRVLLHPTCHRAVHSQGLTVEKPCPPTRAEREA